MRRACKRSRGFGRRIVELCNREVGDVSPRSFAHRIAASEDLVLRLGIHKKLEKHRGCVNTVSFNADGDILVSGSDDRMVILWNWDAGLVKLCFHSGHSNNVFQAKFMPYMEDRIIVTCAADGEVRHAEIREGGKVLTSLLAQHEGRAHKLAIEPGSPYIFYTCGEDGLVQHFDLRTKSATKLFTCKSFPDRLEYQETVQLNAIAIDQRNPNFFAIAGTDEYARVYDIRKYKWDGSTDCDYPTNCFCPPHLIGDGHVGITGLAFSDQSELLTSYSNELIYLFTKDQGLGPNPVHKSPKPAAKDIETGDGSKSFSSSSPADANLPEPQVYKGHHNRETVKGVSFFGPNCEYVTSGSDCGRIFIWRKRDGELLRAMEGDKYVVNCIEPHPYGTVIASSGIENDVKIWTPNALEPAPPVNMDELKRHKRRSRFYRFSFPEDMIAQVLAMQRRRSNSGHRGEDWPGNADLVDLIMQLTDGNSSSDENGDSSGNPGDCIVN
ncbi:uncharacterized protein [Elaeis guineensis]|uniref:DDB1- and CUL4-associated factor 8 n=1 Tax=Elaeis guineensis var. tenera TaxID=51953 RepID=A0A6I9QZZ0_ELAGV|nr:DDB1- and CUL4-associated factor 8 [Elaeis guineensis]